MRDDPCVVAGPGPHRFDMAIGLSDPASDCPNSIMPEQKRSGLWRLIGGFGEGL